MVTSGSGSKDLVLLVLLKCVLIISGGRCVVMTLGMLWMQVWSVGNLDSQTSVSGLAAIMIVINIMDYAYLRM